MGNVCSMMSVLDHVLKPMPMHSVCKTMLSSGKPFPAKPLLAYVCHAIISQWQWYTCCLPCLLLCTDCFLWYRILKSDVCAHYRSSTCQTDGNGPVNPHYLAHRNRSASAIHSEHSMCVPLPVLPDIIQVREAGTTFTDASRCIPQLPREE